MATEVSTKDEAVSAAISDVRNDAVDTNYAICGHEGGDIKVIELRTTGTDITEIASHMDEAEALYCLARLEFEVDMSTVVKFVYIRWLGDKIPFGKKARLGVVMGSVKNLFDPNHLFIETSSVEDLEKDKIMELLKESSGIKNNVLDSSDLANRQMRGFTQTQLPQKNQRPQFNVSAVASKGHAFEILPEVYESVSKVRNDEQPETWTVVGYKDASPKGPMVAVGSGCGDISELHACLDESQPMYGLYRVKILNSDDIATVKFVYIAWIGGKVKPMTKAKITTHKGTAEEIFYGAHASIHASELSELSESTILSKLQQKSS